ncbi:MAG: hypothetical protein QNK37_07695 [Acidobacteriota bacterium]|nr:hypothetical protein [Acidobacteriota bacterium]
MFKKFCLSLAMLAFAGLGVSQLMAAIEILPDQACCDSTWNGNDFFIATYEGPGNYVTCRYISADFSNVYIGPGCYNYY